jgi:hypothetical protein
MAIESFEKEIDGRNVYVSQFPARKGHSILIRLLKYASPVLSKLPDLVKNTDTANNDGFSLEQVLNSDVDIGEILNAVISSVDEKSEKLIFDMIKYVRVDDKEVSRPEVFDDVFCGEYVFLYKVMFFVCKCNAFFGKGGTG